MRDGEIEGARGTKERVKQITEGQTNKQEGRTRDADERQMQISNYKGERGKGGGRAKRGYDDVRL